MNKTEKLAGLLPDDADAALISSENNRRYFTGFASSAGWLVISRTKSVFLTDFRYIEAAEKTVSGAECRRYSSQYTALAEVLRELSVRALLVEDAGMTCFERAELTGALEGITLRDRVLDGIIGEMRALKSNEEVQCIRDAQALTDYGFEQILSFIRPGMTEREIALELEFLVRREGARRFYGKTEVSFEFIVVSGENSSLPHGVPSDRRVSDGDFVTMDFGASVDGWHSDMTRTVCIGKPSDEMRKVYETVLEAQLAALSVLRGGFGCVEADAAARGIISSAGYGEYFGHGTGHGVGIEIHEPPRLSPSAGKAVLRTGNVVTVEPGIYIPKKFGVRIEDMALITDDGCVNLTSSPKELIVL